MVLSTISFKVKFITTLSRIGKKTSQKLVTLNMIHPHSITSRYHQLPFYPLYLGEQSRNPTRIFNPSSLIHYSQREPAQKPSFSHIFLQLTINLSHRIEYTISEVILATSHCRCNFMRCVVLFAASNGVQTSLSPLIE